MQPFNNAARTLLALSAFLFSPALFSQQINILQSGKRVSIRGLSVVDDNTVWASGSSGTVIRSIDGGKNWEWITVPGYEKREFRDIEAFDKNTALILAIAEPAAILKTTDAGKNWKLVYSDTTKGVFLDAMAFDAKGKRGAAVGDPLPGTSFLYELYTRDRGDSWEKMPIETASKKIPTKEGEAFFASSGTNLVMMGNHPLFVSGGKASRLLFAQWDSLPIMQGKESTGANSVAIQKVTLKTKGVVVGGDFTRDTVSSDNCVLFDLDRVTPFNIRKPKTSPHGYRSCVTYLGSEKLVTCGTSGVDISTDGGENWTLISKESFHVVQKAKKGNAVFLAGGGGRIARLL